MAGFRFALILAVCLFLPRESISHSAGAPTEQCDAMTPSHDGKSAQSGAAPFSITANAATYQCGDTITGTIEKLTLNPFTSCLHYLPITLLGVSGLKWVTFKPSRRPFDFIRKLRLDISRESLP